MVKEAGFYTCIIESIRVQMPQRSLVTEKVPNFMLSSLTILLHVPFR